MATPIPGPPGVVLLGNIFDVNPDNPWASLQGLSEKHGEIFKIKVLWQQIVFACSASLCEELCDQTRFRKAVAGPVIEIRHAVHASLFTAFEDESIWGVHHRIIAPTLTQDFVSNYFDAIQTSCNELLARWKTMSTSSEGGKAKIKPFNELNRHNLEACTLALHNVKLNSINSTNEHPWIGAMEGATSEAMKRPNRLQLLNWLLYQTKFDSDTAIMRESAADVLKRRRDMIAANEPGADRKDMLWTLIHGKDPQTGKGLDETQIIDEIVTMPIGSSTAPCLISTTFYYLSKYPGVIAKAREEIDRVLGDGQFTYDKIPELVYCDAIIKEGLRLSFAAPGFNIEPLPSKSTEPVSLANGKYTIPHNQVVIVILAGVNRDPTVFDDPLTFAPERMMPEKFATYPASVKKWFGNGKRECIGKHYASLWSLVTLVMMLRGVDLQMVDPEGYKLHRDGWFNIRPVGLEMLVKGRGA